MVLLDVHEDVEAVELVISLIGSWRFVERRVRLHGSVYGTVDVGWLVGRNKMRLGRSGEGMLGPTGQGGQWCVRGGPLVVVVSKGAENDSEGRAPLWCLSGVLGHYFLGYAVL